MREGWHTTTLNDACIQMNGIWKGTKEPLVPAKILRTTNFSKDCRIKLDDLAIIDVEKKKLDARRLLRGDIIVEKSGGGPKQPVGRVILFDMDDDDYSFCNFTSALRIKDPKIIDYKYLHKYLTYLYFEGETEKYQSNLVGFRNLDFKGYVGIEVPYPSLPEQQRIVDILDQEFAKIDALKANAEKSLQAAKDLFQAALTHYFSGGSVMLGDILNLHRGYDLTHSEMADGLIPVAGSGGIIGYHNVATPISPCITIGRSGSVGKVFVYETCWVHNTSLYVDDFKGNNPFYLVYLLKSLDLLSFGGGSAVPTLNRNVLHPIVVGYTPDKIEQERIVLKLDDLNDRCNTLKENYQKTLTLCDDLKQSLLRKAFNGEL